MPVGITQYVGVDTVVAVHANAHYAYVFDGTTKLFCPFPISDVEARLDTSRFLRVHRGHIVNIERVLRIKRAGDSGVVELDVADRYPVPVSRSRVGRLKSRIDSGSANRHRKRVSIADAVRQETTRFVLFAAASCTPCCRCGAHITTLDSLKARQRRLSAVRSRSGAASGGQQ